MNPMRKVSQHAARNPVARAVARQRLRTAMVEQKIALYLLVKGEPCDELMYGLSLTLATIGRACEFQKLVDPRMRVMRGGLSACQQLMLADSHDPMQTVAIDAALTAAEELNKQLSADAIQVAWHLVSQGK